MNHCPTGVGSEYRRSALPEKDLRQAISLGSQMAEALFKLAMKAKQVAEHNSPPQTAPKPSSPPCSDYELDDVASEVLIRTLERMIERDERRHRTKIVGLLKGRAWDLAASQGPGPRLYRITLRPLANCCGCDLHHRPRPSILKNSERVGLSVKGFNAVVEASSTCFNVPCDHSRGNGSSFLFQRR